MTGDRHVLNCTNEVLTLGGAGLAFDENIFLFTPFINRLSLEPSCTARRKEKHMSRKAPTVKQNFLGLSLPVRRIYNWVTSMTHINLGPSPHECVFKCAFRFTSSHETENASNLLLRMCRRRSLNIRANIQLVIHSQASEERDNIKDNNTFSSDILHLGFWNASGLGLR